MQKIRYQQHRRDRVRFALLILAEDRRHRSSDRVLRTKRAFLFFMAGFSLLIALMLPPHSHGLELSDTPLDIHVQAPPPNVMIVWDNSEHMDWEVMTDEDKGAFSGCGYIFPGQPHGAYAGHVFLLSETQRRLWLSQWGGYNRLYYRPYRVYPPWPGTRKYPFGKADLHFPLSDPACPAGDCIRCPMSEPFMTVHCEGEAYVIPQAHYFVLKDDNGNGFRDSDEKVYLVAWRDGDGNGRLDLSNRIDDDRRIYFRYMDSGDDTIQDDELVIVDDEAEKFSIRPAIHDEVGEVVRYITDREELQNFVNWFSYYRKRGFMTKAALAQSIAAAREVNIGICAVSGEPALGVVPVYVTQKPGDTPLPGEKDETGSVLDSSDQVLDAIYAASFIGPPALRETLDQVGRYFKTDATSTLGASPYVSEEKGGCCQHSHAIVVAGGYWADGFSGAGNADGGRGIPYADAYSDTLADVAMHYYASDLAPDLEDGMGSRGCDDASHQHMVTHTLRTGGPGTLDLKRILLPGAGGDAGPNGGPCLDGALASVPDWPQPEPGETTTVDDIFHAAVNGRGFFLGTDEPSAMTVALDTVLRHISQGSGSTEGLHHGPQVIVPPYIYKVAYRSDSWEGDVQAFEYDPQAGAVGDTPLWSAAERLNRPDRTHESRHLITYGGIWRHPQGIPFRYDDLSEGERQALGSDLKSGSPADDEARRLLDYIRGQDASGYRRRANRLGDIVHSVPVIAGQTLFVGGNDGMLHAFDTTHGDERFAYIPRLVFEALTALASPGHDSRHRFFVDATPYVGEVLDGPYQRNTYLVGGLGKGGRGYFCLLIGSRHRELDGGQYGPYVQTFSVDDISADSSEQDVARIVMWEYPSSRIGDDGADNDGDGLSDEAGEVDNDMGFSFGQGYAVNANAPQEAYRSVVIFGNGYDSPNQHAVLYILDAASGALVRKIDTGADGDNGLSVPALIDVNGDRRVDYAYAGDLNGHLWKFDVTAEDPGRWGVAYGEDLNADGVIDAAQGDTPAPVFHARNQPITARPDVMVMANACAPQLHGYMIVFGTGRYLGENDRHDLSQQSIYGIWDFGDDSDDSEYLGYLVDRTTGKLSNGLSLHPIEVTAEYDRDGTCCRQLSEWLPDYATVEDTEDGDGIRANNRSDDKRVDPEYFSGWYLDFPISSGHGQEAAERVIDNVAIRGGNAVVTSFVPSNRVCASGGTAWLYILDGCGKGAIQTEGDEVSFLPMRFTSRLNSSLTIIKRDSKSRVDQVLLSDHKGRLFEKSFLGESWGKVFWRQNTQD